MKFVELVRPPPTMKHLNSMDAISPNKCEEEHLEAEPGRTAASCA
jgi:hypothetical protein